MSEIKHYILADATGKSAWMEVDDDGDYVLYSDHVDELDAWKNCALTAAKDANEIQEEIASLRAEASGLSESLTDALECEKDYLLEISELRAEVEENEKAMNVWRGRTQRAEAEAEAYRKDAERYRWLRNDAITGTRHDPAVLKDGPTDCCDFMFGDELDAAIDAAMWASA